MLCKQTWSNFSFLLYLWNFKNNNQINLFRNINIIPDEDTGYSYIWSQLKIVDSSQYYPTVATKITFMAIELDQIECGTKPGYIMVLDSNRFGLSHALRYSLSNARNLMTYVQVKLKFIILFFLYKVAEFNIWITN